jgi:hypothetical protein
MDAPIEGRHSEMHHEHSGIAPLHLIQQDFQVLDAAERLRTTWDVERLILLQSVQGHAHEGHSTFHGHRFPNTSMDHISKALRLNPIWVRTERQALIDEVVAYADRVIDGEPNPSLVNDEGLGLLGSSMFAGLEVSGHDVLRGLYLGGLRDGPKYRFQMEAEYGTTIGGGECYLVNTDVMRKMGLNPDILAHSSHEDMIEYYKDHGLIVGDSGPDGGDIEYLYIRHRRGLGASDDCAIIAAGMLYNLGTAIGVFLSDAVDTLEKHVPVFSDQDHGIAERIKARYSKLDVSDEEVRHLTYLSATPEHAPISVPDNSLRFLMRIDRKRDLTAVESHLLFVQGKRYPSIDIGREEVLNADLYKYITDRVRNSPGPR